MTQRKRRKAKTPPAAPSALPMRLEEFFAGLLDSTNLVIYLKDETGRYIYVNRMYEKVSGAPREFIIGKLDADLFSPEIVEVFRAQDEEVKRRKGPIEYEETLSLATGLRSFITEKFPLVDKNGRVYAVGGFCTEITSQSHRANETLAAERERLVATLRSIGEGIISTDMSGGILLMNPTAEQLTGRKSADAVGRSIDEILKPVDGARDGEPGRLIKEAAVSGRAAAAKADFHIVAADGRQRRILPNAAPVHDRTGGLIGVALTLRDVTDQARLESELFQARKLESLGLLAGGIAHDFNNMLTGILGNISLALESLDARDVAEESLAEAVSAAHRAGRLTQQLLTFAKGGDPVRRIIDPAPTVREAASFASRGAKAGCAFDFDPQPWPVSADADQLSQVVSNLVINAVQANPAGGAIVVGLKNEELKDGGAAPLPA
ncbi:MAG: PAS domain-containing protein, partial [Elusimicrobiota bacterium]